MNQHNMITSIRDLPAADCINGLNGHSVINSRLNSTNDEHKINGKKLESSLDGMSGHGEINGVKKTNGTNGIHEDIIKDHEGAPPPIAIVGMGMRLPGGVTEESAFWDLLVNKKDGRCLVPGNRYNIDAFYSQAGKPGTVKTQHGYFLVDTDLRDLDASFFSMNKTEVEKLDPQQRMLLEVVWECMENGGQVGWRGKDIGCYVGVFGEDWLDLAAKDTLNHGMYRITGSADFAIANRISYEYNLHGPSMTIRTGCSSSLIDLHETCQAIYHGECISAVVAETNLIYLLFPTPFSGPPALVAQRKLPAAKPHPVSGATTPPVNRPPPPNAYCVRSAQVLSMA